MASIPMPACSKSLVAYTHHLSQPRPSFPTFPPSYSSAYNYHPHRDYFYNNHSQFFPSRITSTRSYETYDDTRLSNDYPIHTNNRISTNSGKEFDKNELYVSNAMYETTLCPFIPPRPSNSFSYHINATSEDSLNSYIETYANIASKQTRKERVEKICGVCGDRALSYNFDAITCESCKAFFRRNAPKNLDYFKCAYDGRCRVDVSNRRFCKKCRLKKCFEVGMRKEYILSEEEKALKKQKIEANRYKMLMRQTDSSSSSFSSSEVTSQTSALRGEDSNAIDELLAAYKMSLDTNLSDDSPAEAVSKDYNNMADLINIAELSMRRVISMTKQVTAFKKLPQEDQIQLLKSGSIELLILRSVITFDKEKKQFLDPLDPEDERAMKLDQLKKAESGTGLFEDHVRFIWSLLFELKVDETVLILLLMMALFSSDRGNLQEKDYIASQQERYCRLLKKYLNSRFSFSAAKVIYPKLLMKLTEVRSLNEKHSHIVLKLNPLNIQPLMKEVLDLCRS